MPLYLGTKKKKSHRNVTFFLLYHLHINFFSVNLIYKIKPMKRILIKEVDRLYSKIHKDRYVSEYIIYLMENDVKLKAFNVFGEKQKEIQTMTILVFNNFNCTNIEQNIEEKIIQEVSFEDVIKNQ